MSLKRTVQYWRIGFIAISIMILLSVPGCGDTHLEDEQVVESEAVMSFHLWSRSYWQYIDLLEVRSCRGLGWNS